MPQPISYSEHLYGNKNTFPKQPRRNVTVSNALYVRTNPAPKLDVGGFIMSVSDIQTEAEPIARLLAEEHHNKKQEDQIKLISKKEELLNNMSDYYRDESQKRHQAVREAYVKTAQDNLKRRGENVDEEQVKQHVENELQAREIQRTMAAPPIQQQQDPQIEEIYGRGELPEGFDENGEIKLDQRLQQPSLDLNTLLGFPGAQRAPQLQPRREPIPVNPNITMPTAYSALYAQTGTSGGMGPVRNYNELFSDVYGETNMLIPRGQPGGAQQRLQKRLIFDIRGMTALHQQEGTGIGFEPTTVAPAVEGRTAVRNSGELPPLPPIRAGKKKISNEDLIKFYDTSITLSEALRKLKLGSKAYKDLERENKVKALRKIGYDLV